MRIDSGEGESDSVFMLGFIQPEKCVVAIVQQAVDNGDFICSDPLLAALTDNLVE